MNRKEYIGEKIAEARRKKRLSQKAVAELTGIDKTSISKIEKGKTNATIDTIEKLCKAIGAKIRIFDDNCTFEDLVFEKHPFHILADEMGPIYPNYEANKTCFQAKMQFDNGLNISVVIGTPFYSNGVDTYEVCLWSEDCYEEIFPNLTDMDVNNLMEYAQIIEDIHILSHLKSKGFELYQSSYRWNIGYIKHYKGYYIHINPCGRPIIMASKEPCKFEHVTDYRNYESIKPVIDDLDKYIEMLERIK